MCRIFEYIYNIGMIEGSLEFDLRIIPKMLKRGYSLEEIAEVIGMTVYDVEDFIYLSTLNLTNPQLEI